MDRMLYIAMSGAKESELSLAVNTNNLANANTAGFKKDTPQFRSMLVAGPGHESRAYALTERVKTFTTDGAVEYTGRDLDVAAAGDAWLSIQTPAGDEALVKTASLQIKPNGDVWDIHGNPVLGVNGPINIPPAEAIEIGADGTISYVPLGGGALGLQVLTQLKLVKPTDMSPDKFEKGLDGFMRSKAGTQPDPLARVQSGYVQASNVNTVEELVNMISLQRKFELQVKMMETAQKNEQKSDQMLSLR
jgi:flagellar basal-body rod protein FlgF